MSQQRADHLYVIGEGNDGIAKVGRARDVNRRLREIQTGYPRDLVILHVHYGAGHLESRVHQLLQGRRCRGEWFDFGERDPVAEVSEVVRRVYENEQPAGRPGSYQQSLFLACLAETFGPDLATAVADKSRRRKTPA